MKRNNILTILALTLVIALMLCACGGQEPEQTQVSGELSLGGWSLSPETWSSPNGATIHLDAETNFTEDAASAEFVVRQGDADVVNAPCTWNGTTITAEAELNAADGYTYFVVLTDKDGQLTEIPLSEVDSSLTNLASALTSYCNVLVSDSEIQQDKLVITTGSVEIQVPRITDQNEDILCSKTQLVLTLDAEQLGTTEITPAESEVPGGYEANLSGISFDIPAMEQDGQLTLRLEVELSNGQKLSAEGGSWTYMDGQIVSTVG